MSFRFWPRGLVIPQSVPAIPPRAVVFDALHVFVLVGFAIAQPIYDRLSERAALFVDQFIGMPVAYVVVAVTSIGIPAILVLGETCVRWGNRRGYDILHRALIGCLLLLIVVPVLKQFLFLPASLLLILSLLAAGYIAWLYFRHHSLQMIVTLAAPGIVLFPAIFLLQFSANFTKISPSSRRTERFSPVPVVMLVLDEFCGSSLMTPEREIDPHRFPNFAELARTSTWFRNATSVNQNTNQALPALLSGQYPTTAHPPVAANLPQNLFSELTAVGNYDFVAFEPVSTLAPQQSQLDAAAPRGLWSQSAYIGNFLWRVYLFHVAPIEYQPSLPPIPKLWFGMHESGLIDATRTRGVLRYNWDETRDLQFQHFLKTLDNADPPTLYFMHLLLPHVPWCYLPSGSRYADDGADWQLQNIKGAGATVGGWGQDELELINNQQRYLLQLGYVDKLIGDLITRLKASGMYDRCLLVVTADHGVSFRPNQPRRHPVAANLDEILSIPLFVKLPGQHKGGTSDRTVESVDIFPTICDVIGLSLDRHTDGWSVFDKSRPERTRKTYGNHKEQTTVAANVITASQIPFTIRERFGDPTDRQSVYRIDQIPELIGRQIDRLQISTAARVEMEFTRFGDTAKSSGTRFVPCLFEGQLPDKWTSSAPMKIAVAVNGTIQAVTRTYLPPGMPSRQWSVMVPESAFHDGRNDVRIYQVLGTQPNWTLIPCVSVPLPETPSYAQ